MIRSASIPAGEQIIETMLALANCSKEQQIIVTGSKGIEIAFELIHRGFTRAMWSANCGQPAGQYDVAWVDWRQRPLRELDTTLDWLLNFLNPVGVLVVWVDPQKSTANQELLAVLQRLGLVIEATTLRAHGSALAARRRKMSPLSQVA